MLLESIFLVLLAVVLTILGVGMAEYNELKKRSPTLGVIESRTTEKDLGGKILGRTLPNGDIQRSPYLTNIDEIIVALHEGTHSLTRDHPVYGPKFNKYSSREDYSDLAIVAYATNKRNDELKSGNLAYAQMWEDVAYRAIELLTESGRAEKFGTKRRLGDAKSYLDKTRMEIDSDTGELPEATFKKVMEVPLPYTLRRSIKRTGRLFNDKELYSEVKEQFYGSETDEISSYVTDMSLHEPIKGVEPYIKKLGELISDVIELSKDPLNKEKNPVNKYIVNPMLKKIGLRK